MFLDISSDTPSQFDLKISTIAGNCFDIATSTLQGNVILNYRALVKNAILWAGGKRGCRSVLDIIL
jgi:hypothetical protein